MGEKKKSSKRVIKRKEESKIRDSHSIIKVESLWVNKTLI